MGKKGGRGNRGNQGRPNAGGNASGGLSVEDAKLLELAKQARKDNEVDLTEMRLAFEQELMEDIEKKRQEQEAALEQEMAARKDTYEDELKESHKELVSEIEALGKQKEQIIQDGTDLENKKRALEYACQRMKSEA